MFWLFVLACTILIRPLRKSQRTVHQRACSQGEEACSTSCLPGCTTHRTSFIEKHLEIRAESRIFVSPSDRETNTCFHLKKKRARRLNRKQRNASDPLSATWPPGSNGYSFPHTHAAENKSFQKKCQSISVSNIPSDYQCITFQRSVIKVSAMYHACISQLSARNEGTSQATSGGCARRLLNQPAIAHGRISRQVNVN